MDRAELTVRVRKLLWDQLFGVLATTGEDGPHTTIVSFAVADNLTSIVFPTPRATRKYRNLMTNAGVSLFVDDRQNNSAALGDIHGIEARGIAREIPNEERGLYEPLYCARHPGLAEFTMNSALIRISVQRYDVVFRFQNVYVLEVGEGEATPDLEGRSR